MLDYQVPNVTNPAILALASSAALTTSVGWGPSRCQWVSVLGVNGEALSNPARACEALLAEL